MNYEIWLPVVGYEGVYEVSNLGRVRGVPRILTNCQGVTRKWPEYILKPQPDSHGYTQVTLYRPEKKTKCFKIYRLVAEAFLAEDQSEGLEVNHIDGDKSNNTVANLEWVTRLENSQHAWRKGLIPIRYGSETSGAKLSEAQVLQIKALYRRYSKTSGAVALAEEFGVTRQAISDIIHARTWRNQNDL